MRAVKIGALILVGLCILAVVGYLIALGVYSALEFMSPHSCPATGHCPQPPLF